MFGVLIAVAGFVTSSGISPNQFHWEGRLTPGHSIEINNIYGSIHAEQAPGNVAEVLALRDGEIDPVQIDIIEAGGAIRFKALPSQTGTQDGPVNFVVRVPRGVRFVGRTVNGSVEAESLTGYTAAYTVNGHVHMSTSGDGEAETVNGSITASIGRTHGRDLKFSAVNGGIRLRLPPCLNAKVRATTSHGAIHADFPVEVQPHAAGEAANHVLGHGGSGLTLITINGDIDLRHTRTRL